MGPLDTPYKGGLFLLRLLFPDNYPLERPLVRFITPIYHVNVNPHKYNYKGATPLGYISISTLNFWRPETKIRDVLISIFVLLYMNNPETPYDLDMNFEFSNNFILFVEKIRYFTKKYANFANGIRKEFDRSWDFSYK